MMKIPNEITNIGEFKYPENTCAQCLYFRRIKFIDHGVEENVFATMDFCQYPFTADVPDDAMGKLNCLARCDNFEKRDVDKIFVNIHSLPKCLMIR